MRYSEDILTNGAPDLRKVRATYSYQNLVAYGRSFMKYGGSFGRFLSNILIHEIPRLDSVTETPHYLRGYGLKPGRPADDIKPVALALMKISEMWARTQYPLTPEEFSHASDVAVDEVFPLYSSSAFSFLETIADQIPQWHATQMNPVSLPTTHGYARVALGLERLLVMEVGSTLTLPFVAQPVAVRQNHDIVL